MTTRNGTKGGGMQGGPITPALLASHPIYPYAVRFAKQCAKRQPYHKGGHGASISEMVAELERLFPGHYAPATLARYVRHMAKFGLLHPEGHGKGRRYLPPRMPLQTETKQGEHDHENEGSTNA
jgi:hypothetical protein